MMRKGLLLYTLLTVLHMTVSVNSALLIRKMVNDSEGITVDLNMAPNSVDDCYGHCAHKTFLKLQNLLSAEKNADSYFAKVWRAAEKAKYFKPEGYLTWNHLVGIYAYTMQYYPPFYKTFNAAMRNVNSHALPNFPYKSIHFLLTDSMWILKKKEVRSGKPRCVTTYRGTNVLFQNAQKGTEFRFGSFTSSSTKSSVASGFGNKSCFIIKTCFGAKIAQYSAFPGEEEVLIPPYEKFKITKISKGYNTSGMKCGVTYTVKSSGMQSNRVCSWVDNLQA